MVIRMQTCKSVVKQLKSKCRTASNHALKAHNATTVTVQNGPVWFFESL